jgi:hypothetical protein
MPRLAHSVSRFRLAAVYLTVAAALLVTTKKQASLCGEYRDVRVAAEDHLFFVLPWIVVIICQMATIRRQKSQVIFYASFVLSLAVVLLELDELGIGWIQGNGLWMPKWLFCDQQNWVDFELLESFVTGLIIAPFAGVLALATIVVISLSYIGSAISQGPR